MQLYAQNAQNCKLRIIYANNRWILIKSNWIPSFKQDFGVTSLVQCTTIKTAILIKVNFRQHKQKSHECYGNNKKLILAQKQLRNAEWGFWTMFNDHCIINLYTVISILYQSNLLFCQFCLNLVSLKQVICFIILKQWFKYFYPSPLMFSCMFLELSSLPYLGLP